MEAIVMGVISVLVLGSLAVLNLTARVNDAIYIIAPQPGEVRTKLLSQAKPMVGVLAAITVLAAFIYTERYGLGQNWPIVIATAMLMICMLSILLIVWLFEKKASQIEPLLSDRIAGWIATRVKADSHTGMLFMRTAAAMIKVFAFYVGLMTLFH